MTLPVEDAEILDESYDVDAKGLKICAKVKNVDAGFALGESEPAFTVKNTKRIEIPTTLAIEDSMFLRLIMSWNKRNPGHLCRLLI